MFLGQLTVTVPLQDQGERTLSEPLTYVPRKGDAITIPAGTTTDYASVPKILHAVLPPTGSHTYPAVLHDHLYRTGKVTRGRADALFLEAMEKTRVGPLRRWLMWVGVRVGGWVAWQRYHGRG